MERKAEAVIRLFARQKHLTAKILHNLITEALKAFKDLSEITSVNMSGVEVVAAVAGIVSAFAGATHLYREWKKDRRDRQNNSANQNLDQQISTSGPQVQATYDEDFRRLGSAFARGDMIGQNALMQQLITLQQTVISLLSNGNPISSMVIHPNHNDIQNTSSSVRANVMNALSQQYQRLLQAAPVQINPGPTTRNYCDRQTHIEQVWIRDRYFYKCRTCGWKMDNSSNRIGKWLADTLPIYHIYVSINEIFRRYHLPGRDDYFKCTVCGKEMWDTNELINHARADITNNQCACRR